MSSLSISLMLFLSDIGSGYWGRAFAYAVSAVFSVKSTGCYYKYVSEISAANRGLDLCVAAIIMDCSVHSGLGHFNRVGLDSRDRAFCPKALMSTLGDNIICDR